MSSASSPSMILSDLMFYIDFWGFLNNVVTGISAGLGSAIGAYIIFQTKIKKVLDKVSKKLNINNK